jgi:predicted NBD/HSP70 family sugar kinase
MRLINEELIREALVARREATTAELVADTGLSQTTVGQTLEQMKLSGMIGESEKRASSGGRRAASWAIKPKAWTSIAIVVETDSLAWSVADAVDGIAQSGTSPVEGDALEEALELAARLRSGIETRCALAIGVPGAVQNGHVITGDFCDAWDGIDLEERFKAATGLSVVVENDLNAIALGYVNSAEAKDGAIHSLVYIHFNGGSCIGSGLVLGGRIFRGASNFSGELGFLPMGAGKVLDDAVAEAGSDESYIEAIVASLRAVNCVLNPELLVVGGRGFRFDLDSGIRRSLEAFVPEAVRPRLVFAPESGNYYMAGLASLATERAFPSLRLIDRPYSN